MFINSLNKCSPSYHYAHERLTLLIRVTYYGVFRTCFRHHDAYTERRKKSFRFCQKGFKFFSKILKKYFLCICFDQSVMQRCQMDAVKIITRMERVNRNTSGTRAMKLCDSENREKRQKLSQING